MQSGFGGSKINYNYGEEIVLRGQFVVLTCRRARGISTSQHFMTQSVLAEVV